MASAVSSLSYLDPLAYLAAMPSMTNRNRVNSSNPNAAVSATAEVNALQKQGNIKELLNNSVAAALLQPANGVDSGTAMSTLVNSILQQVLGAYQMQSDSS